MKGIFLSNTPPHAPQSFANGAVPIGECSRRVRIVIACVPLSRKWVARCGPILLARMRSLFLAQILSGRRHARSLFAKLSTRQWLGSRRARAVARHFGIGKCALARSNPRRRQQSAAAGQATVQKSTEPVPVQRIPRQQALTTAAVDGVLREIISTNESRPVAAAQLTLRHLQTGQIVRGASSVEGVFRVLLLSPGHYEFRVEAEGYAPFVIADLALNANEVTTLEISLVGTSSAEFRSRLPRLPELGPAVAPGSSPTLGSYRELRHRLDSDPNYIAELAPEYLPPVADIYNVVPNRWALNQPDYRRYPQKGEYLYTKPHWYDPFNRNRFKGDEPIWPEVLGQQIFLNFTASSETFFDGRRVPSPSGVSAARARQFWFFWPRRASLLRSDSAFQLRSLPRRRVLQTRRLAHSHHAGAKSQQSRRS